MSKSLTLKGILRVEIKVRKDGLDSGLVLLKLGENLSNIRLELEKDSLINDTLLFAKGTSEIQRRREREFLLNEIIKEIGGDKFINLKKNPNLGYDLKVLKDELQLECGRKINSDGKIEIAKNNAFILDVMDFKVYKEKGTGMEKKEVSSSGYNKSITELTLNGDINAHGFAKFVLSYGKSKNTMVGSEKKSICHYTYVNKISLKFKSDEKIYFKPTVQFKDEIENAIKIKDHREKLKKFKDITEKFGQFISNEVLIGGRAYFLEEEKSRKFSEEKNKNGSTSVEVMSSSAGMTRTSGKSTETANYSKNECFTLIGGKSDNPNNFDESAWIKSLDDFNNWDCIEYKNPVSIFQFLCYDLREKIFNSIGKRILYNGPEEEYTYNPTLKVNIKSLDKEIKDNIQDDTECNIFATVIDVNNNSKNEFFNCQVLWEEKKDPKLIIHRVRKISRFPIFSTNLQYKLKIKLMVVGYDVNFKFINSDFDDQIKIIKNEINTSSLEFKKPFDDLYTEESICLGVPVLKELNPHIVIGHYFYKDQENNRIGTYTFSYNWEKNCCDKLPEFTFYTLIIPDYHHPGILNFNDKSIIKLQSSEPKYISLYSKGDDCVPIFLRQRQGEIKIKCVESKKKLKINDLMLHFFDNFQDLSKN